MTDHEVDLPSGHGEPPDQFRKVAEVVLVHAVDLPETSLTQVLDLLETVPEDATTGLADTVDLPEATVGDTTTDLGHAVDLPETITQDVAAPQHAIARPVRATHKKPETGG